ncbi:MAG: aminoglycoside phosphotransferase family protein [Oscillospiraceae bacterium]|nr:aminoglycoside phosphotransferase family protein [Oscillospiraceae bacterium]
MNHQHILKQFNLEDNNWQFIAQQELLGGHINNTYQLETQQGDQVRRYVLQRINVNVFKQPVQLMENIRRVTAFVRVKLDEGAAPGQTTLTVYPTHDGLDYHIDDEGGYWRCYQYVENSYSPQEPTETDAYRAGHAFGTFMSLLDDFPAEQLHETIPGFHNTAARYGHLQQAIDNNAAGRLAEVTEEIAFAQARQEDCSRLLNLCAAGEIPTRVTHNDTKLNNVLFDKTTQQAKCVIDLDTIMPGLALYDYGDALRFLGNTAREDARDIDSVQFSMPLFEAYTKGYLAAARDALTPTELAMLPFSIKLMTLECGMRFLTDYLNGDTYFRIHYPDHNLVRCRTQFKLVREIEARLGEMEAFVASLA